MTRHRFAVAIIAAAACSAPARPQPVRHAAAPPPPATPAVAAPPALPAPVIDTSACAGDAATPPATAAPFQIVDAQHSSNLTGFAFDAEGRLATASQDGSVRVWDLATGALVSVIYASDLGHYIQGLYWTGHDLALFGDYLKTATVDPLGHVVAPDQPLRSTFGEASASNQTHAITLDHHGERVTVRVPDDVNPFAVHHVVTASGITAGSTGTTLLIWRTPDGPPATVTFAKPPEQVAIDPAGHTIAVGYTVAFAKQTSITLVDVATGDTHEILGTGVNLPAGDDVLAFSPDGKRLAAAQVGELLVWSVADAQQVARITPKHSLLAETGGRDWGNIMQVTWSPDGRWMVVGSARGELQLFDAATLHHARRLGGNVTRPFGVKLVGDALLVAGPHSVMRWSIPQARLDDRAIAEGVRGLAVIDGDVMVARVPEYSGDCHAGEHAIYFDRWHGTDVPPPPDPDAPFEMPPKRTSWLPPKGSPVRAGYGQARCVPDDHQLPNVFDDTQLVAGDKAISVYRPGAKKPVVLENSPQDACYLETAIAGARVFGVSGCGMGVDNALAVWSLATGKRQRTLSLKTEGKATFEGVHWYRTFDDDTVVLGYGSELGARSLKDGRALWNLALPALPRAVDRWRDTYVVGMLDGTVALVQGGKLLAQAHTAGGEIRWVTVDAARNLAATLSADGSVRLWDLQPLRERVALLSFEDGEWIAYTPGGAYTGTPEVASRVRWTFPSTLQSIGFEQLAATYEQPALVVKRAGGADVEVAGVPREPPVVTAKLVATAGGLAQIEATASSPTRVDTIRAYVEGRLVASARACSGNATVKLSVPLAGDQRVAVAAFDSDGMTSNPAYVDVQAPVVARPDVYDGRPQVSIAMTGSTPRPSSTSPRTTRARLAARSPRSPGRASRSRRRMSFRRSSTPTCRRPASTPRSVSSRR